MNDQIYTVEFLKDKLANDKTWAIRGLLAVYSRQTMQEQNAGVTIEYNGVGFTGADAEILSSFAKQYLDKQWVSDKQAAIILRKMPKYARQLHKLVYGS